MVRAVEDEVVGADYGLCVLRGEVFPVGDVLWEGVESVNGVSACLDRARVEGEETCVLFAVGHQAVHLEHAHSRG